MISTNVIDKAFEEMIFQDRIHQRLDLTSSALTQIRRKAKEGGVITLDYKVKMLQRAGYRFDWPEFTRKEMVLLAKFILNTSDQAREFGPEYLVDKWQADLKKKS